jgi:hypothetical protein
MLSFKMKGSQGNIYDVYADRKEDGLWMTCTCDAGQRGVHCHHRLELLRGQPGALASDNASDIELLKALLAGTTLADALDALDAAEAAQAAAKIERGRRMKAIDRLMSGTA